LWRPEQMDVTQNQNKGLGMKEQTLTSSLDSITLEVVMKLGSMAATYKALYDECIRLKEENQALKTEKKKDIKKG